MHNATSKRSPTLDIISWLPHDRARRIQNRKPNWAFSLQTGFWSTLLSQTCPLYNWIGLFLDNHPFWTWAWRRNKKDQARVEPRRRRELMIQSLLSVAAAGDLVLADVWDWWWEDRNSLTIGPLQNVISIAPPTDTIVPSILPDCVAL